MNELPVARTPQARYGALATTQEFGDIENLDAVIAAKLCEQSLFLPIREAETIDLVLPHAVNEGEVAVQMYALFRSANRDSSSGAIDVHRLERVASLWILHRLEVRKAPE